MRYSRILAEPVLCSQFHGDQLIQVQSLCWHHDPAVAGGLCLPGDVCGGQPRGEVTAQPLLQPRHGRLQVDLQTQGVHPGPV